jgi:hypothetical protein
MSKTATITLAEDAAGGIQVVTRYEGGYDAKCQAHVAAATLSTAGMEAIAEAQGDIQWLTQEQAAALDAAGG